MEENRLKLNKTLDILQKDLECVVCLDVLNDPLAASCNHQFCRKCISNVLHSKTPRCPLCKRKISPRGMKKCKRLSKIISIARQSIISIHNDINLKVSPSFQCRTVLNEKSAELKNTTKVEINRKKKSSDYCKTSLSSRDEKSVTNSSYKSHLIHYITNSALEVKDTEDADGCSLTKSSESKSDSVCEFEELISVTQQHHDTSVSVCNNEMEDEGMVKVAKQIPILSSQEKVEYWLSLLPEHNVTESVNNEEKDDTQIDGDKNKEISFFKEAIYPFKSVNQENTEIKELPENNNATSPKKETIDELTSNSSELWPKVVCQKLPSFMKNNETNSKAVSENKEQKTKETDDDPYNFVSSQSLPNRRKTRGRISSLLTRQSSKGKTTWKRSIKRNVNSSPINNEVAEPKEVSQSYSKGCVNRATFRFQSATNDKGNDIFLEIFPSSDDNDSTADMLFVTPQGNNLSRVNKCNSLKTYRRRSYTMNSSKQKSGKKKSKLNRTWEQDSAEIKDLISKIDDVENYELPLSGDFNRVFNKEIEVGDSLNIDEMKTSSNQSDIKKENEQSSPFMISEQVGDQIIVEKNSNSRQTHKDISKDCPDLKEDSDDANKLSNCFHVETLTDFNSGTVSLCQQQEHNIKPSSSCANSNLLVTNNAEVGISTKVKSIHNESPSKADITPKQESVDVTSQQLECRIDNLVSENHENCTITNQMSKDNINSLDNAFNFENFLSSNGSGKGNRKTFALNAETQDLFSITTNKSTLEIGNEFENILSSVAKKDPFEEIKDVTKISNGEEDLIDKKKSEYLITSIAGTSVIQNDFTKNITTDESTKCGNQNMQLECHVKQQVKITDDIIEDHCKQDEPRVITPQKLIQTDSCDINNTSQVKAPVNQLYSQNNSKIGPLVKFLLCGKLNFSNWFKCDVGVQTEIISTSNVQVKCSVNEEIPVSGISSIVTDLTKASQIHLASYSQQIHQDESIVSATVNTPNFSSLEMEKEKFTFNENTTETENVIISSKFRTETNVSPTYITNQHVTTTSVKDKCSEDYPLLTGLKTIHSEEFIEPTCHKFEKASSHLQTSINENTDINSSKSFSKNNFLVSSPFSDIKNTENNKDLNMSPNLIHKKDFMISKQDDSSLDSGTENSNKIYTNHTETTSLQSLSEVKNSPVLKRKRTQRRIAEKFNEFFDEFSICSPKNSVDKYISSNNKESEMPTSFIDLSFENFTNVELLQNDVVPPTPEESSPVAAKISKENHDKSPSLQQHVSIEKLHGEFRKIDNTNISNNLEMEDSSCHVKSQNEYKIKCVQNKSKTYKRIKQVESDSSDSSSENSSQQNKSLKEIIQSSVSNAPLENEPLQSKYSESSAGNSRNSKGKSKISINISSDEDLNSSNNMKKVLENINSDIQLIKQIENEKPIRTKNDSESVCEIPIPEELPEDDFFNEDDNDLFNYHTPSILNSQNERNTVPSVPNETDEKSFTIDNAKFESNNDTVKKDYLCYQERNAISNEDPIICSDDDMFSLTGNSINEIRSTVSTQTEYYDTQKRKKVKLEIEMLTEKVKQYEEVLQKKTFRPLSTKSPNASELKITSRNCKNEESESCVNKSISSQVSLKRKLSSADSHLIDITNCNQTSNMSTSEYTNFLSKNIITNECGCSQEIAPRQNLKKKQILHEQKVFSIIASGLSLSEMKEVGSFTKIFNVEFNSKFTANTTHVIVRTGPDLKCDRTLKYFQGIAAKKWIVSYKWVEKCIAVGYLLPEEEYEVVGDNVLGIHYSPKRSRLSKHLLLQDYEICCLGPFTEMTREQLIELVEMCGADSVFEPSMFTYNPNKEQIIVAQGKRNFNELSQRYQVMCISREWVIDSIASFSVKPLMNFVLSQPRQNKSPFLIKSMTVFKENHQK